MINAKKERGYTLSTLISKYIPNIAILMYNDFRVLLCFFIANSFALYCHLKRWLFILSPLILSLTLSACTDPIVRTQNVYVPIKCDIKFPTKPIAPTILNKIDLAMWLTKNTMIYTKKLEDALKFCIGGKDGE